MQYTWFQQFEDSVRSFSGDSSHPSLLIASEGPLSVYYAPFEWCNEAARVVLVGITPGRTQAENALEAARRSLLVGDPPEEALRKAKQTGAFSGRMRPNLVAMLDHIGLAAKLGVSSCAELFTSSAIFVQTTSILQFPVFLNGKDYNGTPNPLTTPLLRNMLLEHFGKMAARIPQAIFVPLGDVPSKAIAWLKAQGHMRSSLVLEGLPHPSTANSERILYFLGQKCESALSAKTDPRKLDVARESLLRRVAAL